MTLVESHKWWCGYGRHMGRVQYQDDTCYGWEQVDSGTRADLDAAALLLGYHPTHLMAEGSPFCQLCAMNVRTDGGMTMCPEALPKVTQ